MNYLTVFLFLLLPLSYTAQEIKEEATTLSSDSTAYADERMPVFPGCEEIVDPNEQAKCTEIKILNWIMSHAVYPETAKKNGYQDRVFVTFIINTAGEVEEIEILKGMFKSLNQAAIDAVSTLPKMTPAYQDGKNVKLKYTMPVNFTLTSGKKNKNRKKKNKNYKIID